jgi:hypothetical protein
MFPLIDFAEDIEKNPELAEFIKNACVTKRNLVEDPLKNPKAPQLDRDFSKYFVINNLPICDPERSKKLTNLLIKLLSK